MFSYSLSRLICFSDVNWPRRCCSVSGRVARQRLVDRADLLFGLEASPDDRKEGQVCTECRRPRPTECKAPNPGKHHEKEKNM